MVTFQILIGIVGGFLLCSILCFDLLELAVRRLLLVCILLLAACVLGPIYFLKGMLWDCWHKDASVITARKARHTRQLAKCNALIVKMWTIPVKTAMIEPHIRKAVTSGLKDGLAMHAWFQRSQINPNHPFTVWHPVSSAVKGTAYVGYKEYARATRTKVKPPTDFTIFDVLP